jgi:hypothetical protein
MENVNHIKIIDEICDYAEKNEVKVEDPDSITFLTWVWEQISIVKLHPLMTHLFVSHEGNASRIYEAINSRTASRSA